MIDPRTKEPLTPAQWAELQQVADQLRTVGGTPSASTCAELCVDELLASAPGQKIAHLRPVAEALVDGLRRENS